MEEWGELFPELWLFPEFGLCYATQLISVKLAVG